MLERVMNTWEGILAEQAASPWMNLLKSQDLRIGHYKGYLLETYHYTQYNPQIQAWSSIFFPQQKYNFLAKYLGHAVDEISHDNLALNDLVRLGEDRETIRKTRPLPITSAFISLPFFHVQFESPICYLGQIFMLEFLATSQGGGVASELQRIGVPENAMSFLMEHSAVDAEHNNLMKTYIREMVKTDKDFEYFRRGLEVSSDVFFKLLYESLLNGDKRYS